MRSFISLACTAEMALSRTKLHWREWTKEIRAKVAAARKLIHLLRRNLATAAFHLIQLGTMTTAQLIKHREQPLSDAIKKCNVTPSNPYVHSIYQEYVVDQIFIPSTGNRNALRFLSAIHSNFSESVSIPSLFRVHELGAKYIISIHRVYDGVAQEARVMDLWTIEVSQR